MKNKLRVGALLLTAVMLVSGVYEPASIVVRAEEQTEIEQEAFQTEVVKMLKKRLQSGQQILPKYGRFMEKILNLTKLRIGMIVENLTLT